MAGRQRILEFEDWTNAANVQVQPAADAQITPRVWTKQSLPSLSSEIAGDVEAAPNGRFTLYYSINNLGITSSDIESVQKGLEDYLGDSVVDFDLSWDQDKKLTVTGEKLKDMGSPEDYEDNDEPSID